MSLHQRNIDRLNKALGMDKIPDKPVSKMNDEELDQALTIVIIVKWQPTQAASFVFLLSMCLILIGMIVLLTGRDATSLVGIPLTVAGLVGGYYSLIFLLYTLPAANTVFYPALAETLKRRETQGQ